jgi:hypothetical protein
MLEKREGLVHFFKIGEKGRDIRRPRMLPYRIGVQNRNDEPIGSWR